MAEGERDAFIENDVIGNYNAGTNFLGRLSSRKSKRKTKKRRAKSIRIRRKRRHSKRRVHKRSKRSSGGVKYTKNGQPYKILANGRARFIKGKRRK